MAYLKSSNELTGSPYREVLEAKPDRFSAPKNHYFVEFLPLFGRFFVLKRPCYYPVCHPAPPQTHGIPLAWTVATRP